MIPWWRHQMKTLSALLALCMGNLPVTIEFPAQRPVTRSFDVFFDLCLGWVNNREAGDLRRRRAHFDAIVMEKLNSYEISRLRCMTNVPWSLFTEKSPSCVYKEIPIIILRRADDNLRFIMRIHIAIRRCLLSELFVWSPYLCMVRFPLAMNLLE